MRNNRIVQALFVRPFLFLFLAEVFSQIAMNMMNFILIIVAFDLTNSNTAVSGIVISFTIPAILFGVLAGAYVDRWDKKKVLFLTNFFRGLLLLVLVVEGNNLVVIYAVTLLVSFVTQFFIPAETPMLPLVVPKKLLLSANALFGIGIYGSLLIAYALSGPFLLSFGSRDVFIALAVIYFISSFFVLLIKYKEEKSEQGRSEVKHFSIKDELGKAFSLIYQKKQIYHSLFLLGMSQILILIIGVVGPGYAKDILHISVAHFPLLFVTPAALGMVVGAILLDHFFQKASRDTCATIGVFVCGVAMFILPFAAHLNAENVYVGLILLAFILGLGNALVFVPSNTLLQEQTTDEVRGKIYGTLNSLVGILSLFPIIIVGSLADIVGVAAVMIGISIAILCIGIWRLTIK